MNDNGRPAQSDDKDSARKYRLRDVAEFAGCSASTVSRVLNGHPDVSARVRTAVKQAIAELNYQPDHEARALRSGKTRTIGFLVRDITTPAFADYVMGMQETLHSFGYTLILRCSRATGESDCEALETFRNRGLDGIIVSTRSEENDDTRASLRQFGVPLVYLDREPMTEKHFSVLADHARGVQDATSELLDVGHREIVHITGDETLWPTRSRRQGYSKAYINKGLSVAEDLILHGEYTVDWGRSAIRQIYESGRRPTAIVAAGSQIVTGVIDELRQLDPLALARTQLVACDYPEYMKIVDLPMSAVVRDERLMGELAAHAILVQLGAADRGFMAPYMHGEGSIVVPTHFRKTVSYWGPPYD